MRETTSLLNEMIQNEIPEFDGTVRHRHTFIQDGKIKRYLSDGIGLGEEMPLSILRDCTERELAIWEAYKVLLKAVSLSK